MTIKATSPNTPKPIDIDPDTIDKLQNAISSDGLLLVDKPVGFSSAKVVAIVKRALRAKKVGHGGTLDPFASGLLILGINQGTKKLSSLLGSSKSYCAKAALGLQTTTDDLEGEPLKIKSETLDWPTTVDIKRAVAEFTGEQMQLPPNFSAKHVGGKRAYDLARQGQSFELKPKLVTVEHIELIDYIAKPTYRYNSVENASDLILLPTIEFAVTCSSGTYIRAIARDLGEKLKCYAHLCELRRESIGDFSVDNAINLNI